MLSKGVPTFKKKKKKKKIPLSSRQVFHLKKCQPKNKIFDLGEPDPCFKKVYLNFDYRIGEKLTKLRIG